MKTKPGQQEAFTESTQTNCPEFSILEKKVLLRDLRHAYELVQSGRSAMAGAQIKALHDWIRDDTYTGLLDND